MQETSESIRRPPLGGGEAVVWARAEAVGMGGGGGRGGGAREKEEEEEQKGRRPRTQTPATAGEQGVLGSWLGQLGGAIPWKNRRC